MLRQRWPNHVVILIATPLRITAGRWRSNHIISFPFWIRSGTLLIIHLRAYGAPASGRAVAPGCSIRWFRGVCGAVCDADAQISNGCFTTDTMSTYVCKWIVVHPISNRRDEHSDSAGGARARGSETTSLHSPWPARAGPRLQSPLQNPRPEPPLARNWALQHQHSGRCYTSTAEHIMHGWHSRCCIMRLDIASPPTQGRIAAALAGFAHQRLNCCGRIQPPRVQPPPPCRQRG